MPNVSVVIVTYNSKSFIDRCLEPFANTSPQDIQVIVVDNVSPDGTAEYIRQFHPWVTLIDAKENRGFAAGNNIGFSYATADTVLLLNPDAFVESDRQVLAMADWLQTHPDVAAMGPRLLNVDNTHQVGDAGWRVGFFTLLNYAFFVQRFLPSAPSLYLTSLPSKACSEVDVDWVCGACMVVRRDVINLLGGLDESIFMYGEDVEWGTRMRQAKWRVAYIPSFSVIHLQGGTQKGKEPNFYSTKWIDSILEVFAKTRGAGSVRLAKGIFTIAFMLRMFLYGLDAVIRRRARSRIKSSNSLRYLIHVFSIQIDKKFM